MNRRRPLFWLAVSVACFIGAIYFWRLGDKWQAQKATPPAAAPASNAPSNPANPPKPPEHLESTVTKSASTAPVVDLNPPATNAVTTKGTNAFPYRLSNTTKTVGQLTHDSHAILLENALIDSSSSSALAIPDSLKSHGDPGAYIVQASGPMNKFLADRIITAGATIVSYIPNNAYLVTGTPAVAAELSGMFKVLPWEPYYKVKSSLMPAALGGQGASALIPGVLPGALEQTKAALDKMGVTVVSQSPSPFGGTQLVLQNVPSVAAVAQLPGVWVVEPSLARTPANDLTRVIMSDSVDVFVPTNYLGLSGSNVLVALADSFAATNGATVFNPDLTNIIADATAFPVGFDDLEGHATHVGGIIAGSGLHSPMNAVGSQPGADFRGKATQSMLYALPLDNPFFPDATLQQIAAQTNALISNNSWGYASSDYNLAAASYDQAVRDSIPGQSGSQGLIYVFAAGNNGNGGDDGQGGSADSLTSPGVAKNVISVGASELPRGITNDVWVASGGCNTNDPLTYTTNKPWAGETDSQNEVAHFSSRGNVGIGIEGDFGRFKPDVVAPGVMVVSTRSMTWDTNAYYNITNHNFHTYFNERVATNALRNYLMFVPCGSVELDLITSSRTPDADLPVFTQIGTEPTYTSFNLVGTNILQIPNINPVDTTWFYSVGNDTTNVTVQYDITSDLITTNSVGDYWDVLRTNLNDQLISSNPPPGYPPTLYRYESGTSMAAPAVAGTLALMEDYFTNRLHYTPSPALMKAMLINGARNINKDKYDFQVQSAINYQGWGLVNLTNSLPIGVTNGIIGAAGPMLYEDQSPTNALATGDSRTFFVSVDPKAQNDPLRITLVWTDPPGNPAAGVKLVNDLDLIVTNLDTVGDPAQIPFIYFGNDILLGSSFTEPWDTNLPPNVDNINNVENVYIEPSVGTNYSITVRAHAVNVNAVTAHTNGIVQDYALVVSSGNGAVTNALTLTNANPITADNYAANVMVVTNQFATASDVAGGILLGQHVGASSPLQGTNTLLLSSVTQSNWGNDGQITLGVSNQWHFYVMTNAAGTNGVSFTNAVFATFLPPTLSVPPVGVNATDPNGATRPEADIDLYVARGPDAYKLTNLDETVIANADKSLTRGGTETITYTDAKQDEVFYIGVKSEDQEAAEYAFVGLFALNPFSSQDGDGRVYIHGINVPTPIPDGSPGKAGEAMTLGVAVQPVTIRRAVVTNIIEHQNMGDLFGVLSHNRKTSVLNNHNEGNGLQPPFAQTFIYEDNGENDILGSQHTDFPGTLQNFTGEQGLGLWVLTELDNAQNHTGQVDNIFIRLDPQLGTNGVVATIQPNSFFYDFIDVPPDATNMTVCVNFLNGSPGPVQLFLRYGDYPTLTSYDYTKVINGPSGDCLTISRSDLPPLRPGRYYVGVYNPLNQAQTIRLFWTFGLDPNGVNPTPVTPTNPSMALPDDAVTNNTIFIPNNQNIVTVNVGVVLQHPRVSDLDLTLIAPTGQRILLFENRGGISATNMGHLNIFTNFFGAVTSGTALENSNPIGPVPPSGTLIIDYNFFSIPDQLDVFDGPTKIFSSGLISGAATFTIPYNLVNGNIITIVMNKGNNSDPNTQWTYTPRVVTQDYTYLTFTDNTNVTDMPIKFAIPPYDATDNGTNFTLNDFELDTNGEYIATGTPVTIPDSFGGWTMRTNDVFVRTNYFAGTNLLSMATNQVSVVTDPGSAASGNNFLALAKGSISRTISLVPQKDYDITYRYRGPGITGWWRGEGNAVDSADPEILGNNGSLIGRFNFPAGEVGQAFAMEDSGLAYQFAGTNTYVQVPQSFSLDVGRRSGFTVEGWINPTNITFQQPMVEWLAHVPTNTVVKGQPVTNLVVLAGPFLNRATSHYYYLLGQTNWTTSELWANSLGGHLVEIDDANEQNWVYDTFAQFAGSNYTMWIGLTNGVVNSNFVWSTGNSNVVYTNWAFREPTNCPTSHYTAILSATNGLPGLWTLLDNNGLKCTGAPTNKPFGVVEVNEIQTNGVQFWVSVTNAANPGTGRLYANIFDTNGVPHEIFSPAGLIQSNVYQHVALTYNTNTGVANLYYNGTNVASTNLGVFVAKTGGDVLIGKDMSRATNNFFWGRMDEMSIYSRFLSPSEIKAIYQISASTTNRNIGKFDPEITPSESLGEAQVSFGGLTNLIYGNNNNWQVQGFSLKALSNSLPVQFTGIEPGVLLDSFSVFQKPPGNLYYFPEQPLQALTGSNALGNWTLEIRDARTGAIATNAELISWQLQFILQTNIAPPIQLSPQAPGTNTVPPGQIAYFTVFVPSWANNATNILVSATAPVDLLFNQTTPPGVGSPGDFTFLNNASSGSRMISAVPPSTPPLVPGQTYYLGVRNNGTVPSTVVVRVDFNMTTLTNGVPLTSTLGTNDLERPFIFNVSSNASEATFQLLKMTGNADLVLRKGLPLPTLLDADYGSFAGSNADETIYVLTNSLPVPLSTGPWYLDVVKRSSLSDPNGTNAVTYSVLAKELINAPTVITLANRVPLNYTAGPGAALTNFFKFSVTNFPLATATNLGLRFELFNQSGNGDLTVQTNLLPLAPPFLQSSRLPFNNAEIIFVRTNISSTTNLNADWYLGVPNNETNPISFTILAELETNSFAAFPTAEGSGAYTRGGALATNVYHVTTMADSGPGTLRNGINTLTNGGTIVFDRFGTNVLSTPLVITNSNLTIAGQTAPGNGITIVGAPTYIQGAHDVILRYLRFRSGTNGAGSWSGGFEGQSQQFNVTGYFSQGWHVDSGNIDLLSTGYNGGTAYEGNNYIDLDGNTLGTISTNVATIPGTLYTLSFAYAKNPGAATASANVLQNGNTLGTLMVTGANSYANLGWVKTSMVFTATSPSTQIQFVSTSGGSLGAGVTLDAVSLTAAGPTPYSLQLTNASNIIADHISTAYGTKDVVGVLNSSNVTVQWSVVGEGANTNDIQSGGSEIRYGAGDVTFHHNLYADNYSGNPTIGEDVSLNFENNVIFNWGLFSGFSTNDLANNPGGLTNFLNYGANYLIAGSNTVFTNVAFWGGTPNTWIFQTNNFIDTNKNSILDGANTSWGMFSNQYTPFSHAFDIPPPTAPDEAFIAYERVLDFAGASLEKRDVFDRGVVQRVRLQPVGTNAPTLLSGMSAWWKAENNANDSVGANNGVFNGTVSYVAGEVSNAFNFNGGSYVQVPDGPDLRFTNVMSADVWINLTNYSGFNEVVSKLDTGPNNSWTLGIDPTTHKAYFSCDASNSISTYVQVFTASSIPLNNWTHLAAVIDGATAKIYMNGILSGSLPWAMGIHPGTAPLSIGCTLNGSPTSLFKGQIDEVSLYKRALSDCEIAAIYNSGTNGKTPLLITATNGPNIDPLPYLDVDRDGIPDFWEISLDENPTNYSPNLDRDGDGYTDLEEYMNWLAAPHALTVTNQSTNVDLYVLSGNTGNLRFGVANGTNGSVYLTNSNPCAVSGNGSIAVFTPTNDFGGGTNYGFGSFTYMVTNTDTMAYFGPVTVSVFVSAVPITNGGLSTNIITFTNPPPDQATFEMVPFSITNGAIDSDPAATLTYTISTVVDTNAMIAKGWPLATLSLVPSPTINNGVITWTPGENQGPGIYIITVVATDNGTPPVSATNTFRLTVNEVNRPPVFVGTPPNQTNSALTTFTISDPATDPDIPANPLTYALLNPPAGMTENPNTGLITWTPTAAQAGTYFITNVVTDTNAYDIQGNNSLSATNFFAIVVNPAITPYVFTQPAQAVTGTGAKLNGMATPNGLPAVAWFEWGTNTSYGNQTVPVNIGNGYNVVYTTTTISGLAPNVPYHYRLVASNVVGVVHGFDQIFDQANIVAWGADYVKQIEVPPGLSNMVAIAGAYDHSLALRNNGTVVAWGDDTFSQTNVPAGLNNILAVAGGQYSSMALRNTGTVAEWGGNILAVTNVPTGLNNVVMIASGTTTSLALKNNGTIAAWGANLFNVNSQQTNLANVVEVAGGSYHCLAIKNDGTIIAWGDNSAGQTNVPPSATNIVAIAGGNYHSLALRSDGTVLAWGDNSSGQTNVPPGLSNVVAIAAGGFHSLALKSDGSVVGWGDNTAGQGRAPAGLTNVVAISSGYFHSLALTPTLLTTNVTVLDITNGAPQTNSVLSGSVVFYRVQVPIDVDAATNELLFALNGPLNMWYTTNTPPSIGLPPDFELLTNSFTGTSVVAAATSPQLMAGKTYYLGLQNTNTFSVSYVVQVDFHFVPITPLTNGVPVTNAIPSGGLAFYQVDVPTNADFATNLLFSGTGPLDVWFSTNVPPTITNADDFLLIPNAPSGSSTLSAGSTPQLQPGTTYYLGVHNSGASSVSYGIGVNFHFPGGTLPPSTNTIPISGVIHTNINGTNGFLLVWYAPTNDLFQVQWSPGLLQPWNTFTNIIGFHTFIDPTNSEFEFFDDGSQTGGSLGSGRIYRLILLNPGAIVPSLPGGSPVTNTVPAGSVTFYQVNTPTNANYATNSILSATAPVNLWYTTNVPPSITNPGDLMLIPGTTNGAYTTTAGSVPPSFVPGSTYYLGVENTNTSSVTYTIQVDFHLITGGGPSTNPVPISTVTQTNINGTNGFLLVWYAPAGDLFQVQWSPGLLQPWNTFTNIIGVHTFIDPTNSEFEFFDDGSQTGGTLGSGRIYRLILLNSSAPTILPLTNGVPASNSVPSGAVTYYQVNVPTNADYATNLLLSAAPPLNVWFSTNNPPTTGNANDFLLIPNAASGSSTLNSGSTPKLVPGSTYYLGIQNTNAGTANFAVRVDFHLATTVVSTNPVPISSLTVTNINGTNAFMLVWFAPTNDLFQVQWSPSFPPSWSTFTNIISYNTFITPTNSKFVFLDDGSQSGGLSSLRYYRLILYNGSSPSITIVPLTDGVPVNFTTGTGQTNFFSFDITQTNASVLFELYNLTGNGDLTLQRGSLPVSSPYFTNSANAGTNFEQIVLRTNGTLQNLNAVSWFLGVPNQSASPISYTIRAMLPTNGILVSGMPINAMTTQPGGSNVQINWGPTVVGERYEIRTNANLVGTWGVLTDLVATGTSMTFTDPTRPSGPLYYRVVQVP